MNGKKITLVLQDRTREALNWIVGYLDSTQTSTVNRAIILFKEVVQAEKDGSSVYIEDKDGHVERIKLL